MIELVGTVLLRKYRVDRVLATGGMGLVARAHHLLLDRAVAIKLLLPDRVGDPAMVRRFLREARAASGMRSEHVCRVFDAGILDNGSPFMVMEYLQGQVLGAVLARRRRLHPALAVDLLLQACQALAEVHRLGIVHRDIKPDNLFITHHADGSPLLKLIDFGIAKLAPCTGLELTDDQAVMGTPPYMSPEQIRSSTRVDARSDVWALGVVLYQLLTGRRPFHGGNQVALCFQIFTAAPAAMDDDLPPGLVDVVLRCLAKSVTDRPADVAELADALVPYASHPARAGSSARCTAQILRRAPARPGSGGAEDDVDDVNDVDDVDDVDEHVAATHATPPGPHVAVDALAVAGPAAPTAVTDLAALVDQSQYSTWQRWTAAALLAAYNAGVEPTPETSAHHWWHANMSDQ